MQRSSGSAGRPADHCAESSDPPDYMESPGRVDWTPTEWAEWENPGLELSGLEPDYMESPGWVDWTLTEWAEWENPGLELSGLEPELLRERSNCSSDNRESSAARPGLHHGTENTKSSAAQPAHHSSHVDNTMAGECMSTTAAKNLLHYSHRELPEVVHEILFHLPPQCLLKLSVASQALHHDATCNDVCRVAIYGSLLPDLFASGSRRRDAQETDYTI